MSNVNAGGAHMGLIERIIYWSLHNRALVLIGVVFLTLGAIWSVQHTPVDAIPDLSENQVIIMTDWMGRAPQLVEDQVTYPLQSVMLGLPKVKAVRGLSMFGLSMLYVIFEDRVDIYWARTRVLEKLAEVQGLLPPDARVSIGPDGTGVGHIFWYTVEGEEYDLATLRAIQDYYLRFGLATVEGVAEVAPIGGFVKEYQIDLDPRRMQIFGVSTMQVMEAVKNSNIDVGGGLIERSSMEYLIRGLGYIKHKSDLENLVLGVNAQGVPVKLSDVATVQLGGQIRRGILEKDGKGEVVGGIVVMRYGENARDVIRRVKTRLEELKPGLPPGVRVEIAYDRSRLIQASLNTLRRALIEETIIVALVILIFLFHFPSSLVVIIALPIAAASAFIVMLGTHITSNLMSLAGIAIAIGVMVDAGIIVVENCYRHLSEGGNAVGADRMAIIWRACRTVGRPIFFSLAIIILSFLPVFLLTGQEGKLFFPLAMTKTAAMIFSAILAITLVPVLCYFFLRGYLPPEEKNPIARFFNRLYEPILIGALRHKTITLGLSFLVLCITVWMSMTRGSEFMPALDEGDLLYMPTTLPNISITEAKRILQVQDKILKSFPEVELVLGKVGRAETATDPAPISMIETIIILKPHSQWREGLTREELIAEMDQKLQIPGVTNGWTMPIINRINMLATGVRTDLGVKFYGPDLKVLEELAVQAERVLKTIPGAADVYAERFMGGNYIDIIPDRQALARYGVNIGEVLAVLEASSGGMVPTLTVEGRARFPVRIRYARDFRASPEELGQILIPTRLFSSSAMSPSGMVSESDISMASSMNPKSAMSSAGLSYPRAVLGSFIPLSQVAQIKVVEGPAMIASENSLPRSVVVLNVRGRDIGGLVKEADQALRREIKLPPGYFMQWSGQWENQQRARQRLMLIVPIVTVIIFILLYFIFHSFTETALVMITLPFALTGGVVLIWLLRYNWSVAVWVGFIGLFGIAVETGVVMMVYLYEALNRNLTLKGTAGKEGTPFTREDLYRSIKEGAVLRLRPKLMTVGTSILGLMPIMWSRGTGADIMKPLATPMVGGLLSSMFFALIVIPVIFAIVKEHQLKRGRLTTQELYF